MCHPLQGSNLSMSSPFTTSDRPLPPQPLFLFTSTPFKQQQQLLHPQHMQHPLPLLHTVHPLNKTMLNQHCLSTTPGHPAISSPNNHSIKHLHPLLHLATSHPLHPLLILHTSRHLHLLPLDSTSHPRHPTSPSPPSLHSTNLHLLLFPSMVILSKPRPNSRQLLLLLWRKLSRK